MERNHSSTIYDFLLSDLVSPTEVINIKFSSGNEASDETSDEHNLTDTSSNLSISEIQCTKTNDDNENHTCKWTRDWIDIDVEKMIEIVYCEECGKTKSEPPPSAQHRHY
jgi:hypothetical protein